MELDLVIEGGLVVLPSGETRTQIGIRERTIVALGELSDTPSARRLDVDGCRSTQEVSTHILMSRGPFWTPRRETTSLRHRSRRSTAAPPRSSTGHCPSTTHSRPDKRRVAHGLTLTGSISTTPSTDANASAFDVPNGLPGIETRFPLVYEHGVMRERLTRLRFAEAIAENPPRIAGIYHQKGVIAVGSDADMTIIDPADRGTVTSLTLHQASDWTPYEGLSMRGWPTHMGLQGQLLIEDHILHEDRLTRGAFLPGTPRGFLGVR